MKIRWWMGAVVAFLWVFALAVAPYHRAQAEEGSQVALWVSRVDVTHFPDVTAYLSVWTENGLPVSGLTADNFELREDGGGAFHPQSVVEDTHSPLQVVLVLDVSGSMAGKPLEDAKVAAIRFLDRLESGDQAAVIAFSSPVDPDPTHLDGKREVGFTQDISSLYDVVEHLQSGGKTALYQAVQKAVAMAAKQPTGHRAVLLLTDGRNDPPDVGDPDVPITLAQEQQVPVFVIGMGKDIDEQYLRRLAGETGGVFRPAPSSGELAQLFDDMATLLKTRYRLTYHSNAPADGQSHTLDITVYTPYGTASLEKGFSFGPVPSILASPTPLPSLSATALAAQPVSSPTPVPSPTVAPTTVVLSEGQGGGNTLQRFWLPVALIIALILLIILWLIYRRSHHKPPKEYCAQCGYDLTGHVGACPVCGSTKRLTRPKGH